MSLTPRQKYEAARMSRGEFAVVLAHNWLPIQIDAAARPGFLNNLPDAKIVAMFGSASLAESNPRADGNPDYGQIGGIDVYREAESTDSVKLNKDWYAVFLDPGNSNILLVVGPKKDREHWINDIPERLHIAFAEPAPTSSPRQPTND